LLLLLAVRRVESPRQKLLGLADTETTGNGITVTATLAVSVHPAASVTVSTYVVVVPGEAVGLEIAGLFSPVAGDQAYVLTGGTLLPLKTELPPIQIVAGFALALATGGGKILKLTTAVSGPHSFRAITRTVCVPTVLKAMFVGLASVDDAGFPLLKLH
jgi:hypothetical protein